MPLPKRHCLLLTLVIAVAAVPRCWNITNQHVEDYDGAALTLEGQLVVTVTETVGRRLIGERRPWPELPQVRGMEFTYAKPLHSLSLATGQLLGIPRTQIGPIFSALWGVLAIGCMYLLAKELWGPTTGLAAAACYGISGYAAFYCRIAAAESFCFLWLIVALWQYARLIRLDAESPSRRRAIGVGILWSLVALANYRIILVVAVVLTVGEAIAFFQRGPRSLKRSAWIALGLFVPLLLTEAAFRAALYGWSLTGAKELPRSYWQQLSYFFFERRSMGSRFEIDWLENLYNFAQYWRRAEGPWLPLAGVAGMIATLAQSARFRTAAGGFAISAVVVALFWSRQDVITPRASAVLCVFLAPFAGFIVTRLVERFCCPGSRPALVGLSLGYVVLLALMVHRIGLPWFSQPSGFIGLDAAVARVGDGPLYGYWRQHPPVMLYVTDRAVQQINEGFNRGRISLSNMPDSGLLVAPSDYVARHYPSAEVLHRFRLRVFGNELALAEDVQSWDAAVRCCAEQIEICLVRINGPAIVTPPSD